MISSYSLRSCIWLEALENRLQPSIALIAQHPVFKNIKNQAHLRCFSEHHVFAVWDFMSLLKKLQLLLTCVKIPWLPGQDGLSAHLINTLVAEEEADINSEGHYLSHFEMYLAAMNECNANVTPIKKLLSALEQGDNLLNSLQHSTIPLAASKFMQTTFAILQKRVHEITANFLFGREYITSSMFQTILINFPKQETNKINKFLYYFQRHIELDKENHTSKGKMLLMRLCGADIIKWQEVECAAKQALQARYDFLNAIYHAIQII